MSVYVDPMMACLTSRNWRYAESCHLFADSIEELHQFAIGRLKLKGAWFQNRADFPHYDLTRGKRRQAMLWGAVAVDAEETVEFSRKLRAAREGKPYQPIRDREERNDT